MNWPHTKGQTQAKPTGTEMWMLPNLRVGPRWGRGTGLNRGGGAASETFPTPSPRLCPAPYTSVPPDTPARVLLVLLDSFLSRCGLVQFPQPALSNPAPCPEASSPTGRVLRTISWPPGGHPGACSTFWHVLQAFRGQFQRQGLPGIVGPGLLGTPGATSLRLFICRWLYPSTHYSLPPSSSPFLAS